MKAYTLLIFLGTISLFACSDQQGNQTVVAKAFEYNLLMSEIEEAIPSDMRAEDSVAFAENYIRQWIDSKVLLHKARNNVRTDYSNELREYEHSLLVYDYQRQVVDQLLDTKVSDEDILTYYTNHQENFLLRENILRCLYVKMRKKETKQIAQLKKRLFGELTDDNRKSIASIASSSSVNFFLDDEVWLRFQDVLREIPLNPNNEDLFLSTRKTVEIQDDDFVYLLRIVDYKNKESVSPLIYEQKNIREIILNQRKVQILNNLRIELVEEAERNGNIKTHI